MVRKCNFEKPGNEKVFLDVENLCSCVVIPAEDDLIISAVDKDYLKERIVASGKLTVKETSTSVLAAVCKPQAYSEAASKALSALAPENTHQW